MDEKKIEFIDAKRLSKTIEKEAESHKPSLKPELKGATNPITAGLLKFSSSKYKFNLKDI